MAWEVTVRDVWPVLLLCGGCASSVGAGSVPVMDAGADDVAMIDAPVADVPVVDVTVVDASVVDVVDVVDASAMDVRLPPRCDPSVIVDAGETDAGTPDGAYVVSLSIEGWQHQCAVMSDRTVRCRGFNNFGELGRGEGVPGVGPEGAYAPAPVLGLTDVVEVVSTGFFSVCALRLDGTVWCWGNNHTGLIGVGHNLDVHCPNPPGDVECRLQPTRVSTLTDVVDIAAASFSVCAVRADGTVWCWGNPVGRAGERSETPVRVERFSDVTRLSINNLGWIATFRDGHAEVGTRFESARLDDRVEVFSGGIGFHYCARMPDSSVRCAGFNDRAQLGDGTGAEVDFTLQPPTWPEVCGVRSGASGGWHSCAVLADRRVSCWGDVYSSTNDMDVDRCPDGGPSDRCTLHPTLVEGVDDVDRLYAGAGSTCAIRLDHSVWCWGSLSPNDDGSPGPVAW